MSGGALVQVHVLFESVDYEGDDVRAVYAGLEQAEAEAARLNALKRGDKERGYADRFYVQTFDVVQAPAP